MELRPLVPGSRDPQGDLEVGRGEELGSHRQICLESGECGERGKSLTGDPPDLTDKRSILDLFDPFVRYRVNVGLLFSDDPSIFP